MAHVFFLQKLVSLATSLVAVFFQLMPIAYFYLEALSMPFAIRGAENGEEVREFVFIVEIVSRCDFALPAYTFRILRSHRR